MSPAAQHLTFYLLAASILFPALMVVASRNIVHSAFWLLPCFLGVGGTFLFLGGEFVFAIQVLIYAGAIMVLLLFALMLTRNIADPRLPQTNEKVGWALVGTGALMATLALVVSQQVWPESWLESPPADPTRALGHALLSTYLLPFEVASVLLLAAIVGAIVIARPERGQGE